MFEKLPKGCIYVAHEGISWKLQPLQWLSDGRNQATRFRHHEHAENADRWQFLLSPQRRASRSPMITYLAASSATSTDSFTLACVHARKLQQSPHSNCILHRQRFDPESP